MTQLSAEKKKLGQTLVERRLITQEQLQRALEYQKKDPRTLGEILHTFKLLNEEDLLKVLSIELGTEYFPTDILMDMDVPSNVLAFLTKEQALDFMVCPLEYNVDSDGLLVAMAYPQDVSVLDKVKDVTGVEKVETCICFEYTLYRLVNKNYDSKMPSTASDEPDPKEDTGEGFMLGSDDDTEAFPGIYGNGLDEELASPDESEQDSFYLGDGQGISGNLMDLGLLEMLQIMGAGNKTCRIRIVKEDEKVDIYMQDGRIVNCIYDDVKGEDAFYAVIGWNEGHFHIATDETTDETLIERSLDGLILEGLRRLDEANQ